MFFRVHIAGRTEATRTVQIAKITGDIWLNVEGHLRILPVTVVGQRQDSIVIEITPSVDATPETFASAGVIVSPISDPAEGMAVGSARERGPARTKIAERPDYSQPLAPREVAPVTKRPRPTAKVAG